MPVASCFSVSGIDEFGRGNVQEVGGVKENGFWGLYFSSLVVQIRETMHSKLLRHPCLRYPVSRAEPSQFRFHGSGGKLDVAKLY